MLTIASRLDVMNRLGRALADPTRSRIILTLLDHPAYPAELARALDLTRPNVSNHLACLRHDRRESSVSKSPEVYRGL